MYGQIGDGTFSDKMFPTKVIFDEGEYATSIALGATTACAILNTNTLKCWGRNDSGEVGDGTTDNRSTPTKVNVGVGTNATSVAVGRFNTCALLNNGSVKCWGFWGRVGIPDVRPLVDVLVPTIVNLGPGNSATSIVMGDDHTCVMVNNGSSIICWGSNEYGQLGVGTTSYKEFPGPVQSLLESDQTVTSLYAGAYHTCALLSDNTFKCWGQNTHGQISLDGTSYYAQSLPTLLEFGVGKVPKIIGLGGSHSCVVLTNDDDVLRCWGWNERGQIGNGDSRVVTIKTSLLH